MDAVKQMMRVHDLDALLRQAEDAAVWGRLGYDLPHAALLERERERLLAGVDRRWTLLYERGLKRYGRGLTPVRERVCLGCFVQLAHSVAPPPGESMLHLCESCGRLLHWG